MNIIVAGCGKVGTAITKGLVKEGHDITVMDIQPKKVNDLINMLDVQGIYGNAADSDALAEAEVSKTDLFIAVTASDELNMLACLFARRMGASHTIARVRNTDYNDDSLSFIKQELHLSMSINPDYEAAQQLFNILKLPSAVQIDTFSNKNIEMVELKLKKDSVLDGMTLSDMRKKYKIPFLVCTVIRDGEIFIPDGNFTLKGLDRIGLVASPADLQKMLKSFSLMQKQARNIMILGGSRTSYYLAKKLSFIGNSVKIIDKDENRCREIASLLPSINVVTGDGTNQELLFEEGIRSMDAFIALTGTDEENILLSVFASSINVPKVITKVNSDELGKIAVNLGLDCIISPKKAVTDIVTRYARALHNTTGNNIETLYHIADDKAEALEFKAGADFSAKNIPLKHMKIKKNTLIAGIVRGRKTIIPSGDDCISPNDRVIVITAGHSFKDLSDILK
ncbi:MAG: Trk system potassium transporter TrkA [Oscillospiraceae bacterium]|nr:Trk system potassium transporter TrkA [Oscillospiraceae bacterium]